MWSNVQRGKKIGHLCGEGRYFDLGLMCLKSNINGFLNHCKKSFSTLGVKCILRAQTVVGRGLSVLHKSVKRHKQTIFDNAR